MTLRDRTPSEYGRVAFVLNPETDLYDVSGVKSFPISVRHGVELIFKEFYGTGATSKLYLGGKEMPWCWPKWQNSGGAVLGILENGTLADLNIVNGVVNVVVLEPFSSDDVWGFNAAKIDVTDAQGNMSKVDAPQLVGTDLVYGQTPFVYEENPLSKTYVEYATNALVYPDDNAIVGGGVPAATHSSAAKRPSSVDADSDWTIISVTGINDDGVFIAVANNKATGQRHAIKATPIKLLLSFNTVNQWASDDAVGNAARTPAGLPYVIGQLTDDQNNGLSTKSCPYEYIYKIKPDNSNVTSSSDAVSDMSIYEANSVIINYYANGILKFTSTTSINSGHSIYNPVGKFSFTNVNAPATPIMYVFDAPDTFVLRTQAHMKNLKCDKFVTSSTLVSYPLFRDPSGSRLDSTAKQSHMFTTTCISTTSDGSGPYQWSVSY